MQNTHVQNILNREHERLKRIHKFIETLYNCDKIGNDELALYLNAACVSSLHDENLTSVIDYLIQQTENNEMIGIMEYVKKEFLLKQIETNEFSVMREEKIRILKEKLKKMEEKEMEKNEKQTRVENKKEQWRNEASNAGVNIQIVDNFLANLSDDEILKLNDYDIIAFIAKTKEKEEQDTETTEQETGITPGM